MDSLQGLWGAARALGVCRARHSLGQNTVDTRSGLLGGFENRYMRPRNIPNPCVPVRRDEVFAGVASLRGMGAGAISEANFALGESFRASTAYRIECREYGECLERNIIESAKIGAVHPTGWLSRGLGRKLSGLLEVFPRIRCRLEERRALRPRVRTMNGVGVFRQTRRRRIFLYRLRFYALDFGCD